MPKKVDYTVAAWSRNAWIFMFISLNVMTVYPITLSEGKTSFNDPLQLLSFNPEAYINKLWLWVARCLCVMPWLLWILACRDKDCINPEEVWWCSCSLFGRAMSWVWFWRKAYLECHDKPNTFSAFYFRINLNKWQSVWIKSWKQLYLKAEVHSQTLMKDYRWAVSCQFQWRRRSCPETF